MTDMRFFRPASDTDGPAEYVDPITGRHFNVRPGALPAFLRSVGAPSEPAAAVDPRRIQSAAMDGYWSLSSRIAFRDRKDSDGLIRIATLDNYHGGPPLTTFRKQFIRRCFDEPAIDGAPSLPNLARQLGIPQLPKLFARARQVRADAADRSGQDHWKAALAPLDSFLVAMVVAIAVPEPDTVDEFSIILLDLELLELQQLNRRIAVPTIPRSIHLLVLADFNQYQWRYRHDRALRHLWLDAGYLAEEFVQVARSVDIPIHRTSVKPWQASLRSRSIEAEIALLDVFVIDRLINLGDAYLD